MRRVMYVFLPDWPIDRLRRLSRLPEPRPGEPGEAPFATVAAARGGRFLAAINPAAAAAGLASGMPLTDALSFVPDLLTAAAEPAADAAALIRLAEWCGRYSPWTAPDGMDGIKIEITGCAHLWGGEERLVADFARRLADQGLAPRIAIAGTPGAAAALARFAAAPGRPALPGPGEERAALAPLPVEALRLDPATVVGLRRVGLRRVGDLYPMPRAALARRFGEAMSFRLDQALGVVPEPLSPLGEPPVRQVRLGFVEPIAAPADLGRAIEILAAELAVRLEREGSGARRLDLAFRRVDGRIEHIRVGTARPSREAGHLAGLLAAKLETVDPGLGIEDMILALLAAEKLVPEQSDLTPLSSACRDSLPLWEEGGNAAIGSTASLLDRLGSRLGLERIGYIAARGSHIPERASLFVPIGGNPHPDPLSQAGEGARLAGSDIVLSLHASLLFPASGRGQGWGWRRVAAGTWLMPTAPEHDASGHGILSLTLPSPGLTRGSWGRGGWGHRSGSRAGGIKLPRPVRLFAPPEPVEAVWVLPDEPPFRFIWRRRAHRVRRAEGPERIAEEWWTVSAAAVSAGALRDYYRVEDDEGRRFWLFRAGLPGMNADRDPPPRWFVHGVFA